MERILCAECQALLNAPPSTVDPYQQSLNRTPLYEWHGATRYFAVCNIDCLAHRGRSRAGCFAVELVTEPTSFRPLLGTARRYVSLETVWHPARLRPNNRRKRIMRTSIIATLMIVGGVAAFPALAQQQQAAPSSQTKEQIHSGADTQLKANEPNEQMQREADKGAKTRNSGESGYVADQDKPGASAHPPGQPQQTTGSAPK
jgi:hypothetical protein